MILSAALAALVTGCGTASAPPEGPAQVGSWTTQHLVAEVGADQAPVLGVSGEDAVALAVSEEGRLQPYLSRAGAQFEVGETLETGLDYLLLNQVVGLPGGGWFTVGSGGSRDEGGDTELSFQAVAFRSSDGLTWERTAVSGFAHPVEISDVVVVDDLVVAAGSYRTAVSPGMGGFEAHVWTSADGSAFQEVDLPDVVEQPSDYKDESSAGHLAVDDGRVLLAGRVGRRAALWTPDAEPTGAWIRLNDPLIDGAYSLGGLEAVGRRIVATVSGGPARTSAVVSDDGGRTWSPVDTLPAPDQEAEGWTPLWADRSRFWTLTGVDDDSWFRPEVCYADLDQCGREVRPRVMFSADTVGWSAADLPTEVDEITGTIDGRVLALGVDRSGLVLHTLAAGRNPPTAEAASQPKTVPLVQVPEGQEPEVGIRYHAPMYLHCGMTWFYFGDGTWRRTDAGRDAETGAGDQLPAGWPAHGQMLYGYATLVDSTHLEYSTGDEVIATYERAQGAPGCG